MTASAFLHRFFEALIGSDASGPVQKTVSEKTCACAVNMLPIGSSSMDDFPIHQLADLRLKIVLRYA